MRNKSIKILSILILLFILFLLPACSSEDSLPNETAKVTDLSASEFKDMMTDEFFLLDVRTQEEYDERHIEDAILFPVDTLEKRIDEISQYKDTPILVYCRSGNRSVTASQILIDNGFTKVYNLKEGINSWKY